VTISKTFPALCVAAGAALRGQPVPAHLHTAVTVTTVDYHGNPRTGGGDPLSAQLQCIGAGDKAGGDGPPVTVRDNDDGTYTLEFTPTATGTHQLSVWIFDRPVKDSPFDIQATMTFYYRRQKYQLSPMDSRAMLPHSHVSYL